MLVQNDMDALEQIQGVPPGMYHRYGVLDDMDDDDDEPGGDHIGEFNSNNAYNADMLVAGMAGLGVNDSAEEAEQPAIGSPAGGTEAGDEAAGGQGGASISNWSLLAHPGGLLLEYLWCRPSVIPWMFL